MNRKMAYHGFKRRIFSASLGVPLTVAVIFTPLFSGAVLAAAPTAKGAKAAAASSPEVVDRINKAIQEAQKKLGANPVVEEVRKDIHTNMQSAKTTPAYSSPSYPASTVQPPSAAGSSFGQTASPAVETMKFKSADPRKQANELAWKASGTYVHKDQYFEAHELASEALRMDPDNRVAKEVQSRINKDIQERAIDIGGTDKTITPPDGRIALTIALSDGVVTLSEAEEVAVKGSMMLESLRHRAAGARSKVREAFRAFFPTAGFETSLGGGTVTETPYDSQKYMLTFSQPVFYGGELIFTLKQAEAGAQSDELKYQKERTDVLKQVGEAYRNAVNAKYNLDYQEDLYKQITVYKNRHDKEFDSKLVAEIEHLEISSIYNQVEFQKESAITTQKSANLTLCQSMGVDAGQPVPVDPAIHFEKLGTVDMGEYLNRVGTNNYDIRIKRATLESAYYGAKVFDAQRQPRVDIRGNAGVSSERSWSNNHNSIEPVNNFSPQVEADLEKDYAMIATVSIPWGSNTTNYSYQRRFFAPSVSSFQGSEDYKNSITTNFADRLSKFTDEEIAKADYLKAMAELQKERADQEINARQAYYDYESAVLQLETSEAKIIFRERQVKILEQTTQTEEAKLTELINELVNLTEDRYSRITSISSANNALAKMDYLAGMEGTQRQYEVQSPQK